MPRINSNFYSLLSVPSSPSSSATKFDAAHNFVTSPFIRSPFILAFLRLLIGVYTMVTLIIMLAWSSLKLDTADGFFSYFTHLSYTGICAYFFASGVQTFFYALKWKRGGAGVGYPLQKWWRAAQAAHVVLQVTVITFPIIVTVVYWALLASSDTFSTPYSAWSAISAHIFNTVFCLFEIILTNLPPAPWFSLFITIILLAGYLGVAYITHATQGFYAYSFLDPQKQGAKLAAYIVGIAVGQVVVFCIVRGLIVLRERWAMRTGRVLAVRGEVGSLDGDEDGDWEEVAVAGAGRASGKGSEETKTSDTKEEGSGEGAEAKTV